MKHFTLRLFSLLLILCICLTSVTFAEDDDEEIVLQDITPEQAAVIEEEEEAMAEFDFSSITENIEIESSPDDVDTSINADDLELNTNLPDNVINILLVGIDTRAKTLETGLQHNDVNIILSINTSTGELKLTSLLRDLYVTIPGYKKQNRLNLAYARGNGALAMRTINHNFEMNIQRYVAINFYGLASIIDSIGGIDVDLEAREAGAINTYLRKNPPAYDNTDGKSRVQLQRADGIQHLDGVQAVMYARLREIDNDFARTQRQRHLLELLLHKVLADFSIDQLFSLMDGCLSYVMTNMTFSDMGTIGVQVLNSGILGKAKGDAELLQQHRIPMDGTFSYQTKDGNSVVFMGKKNFPLNVEALHEFIYGSYIPAP